jgi:RNA polymerase sigma factor (sigma-70 family)
LATLAAPGVSATARSRVDVTDHDLVQAVRQGDDHAFERLYRRYHRRIAAYIFGMVRDDGRAEDLTQEVFVSALRRMRQTERPITFKPWIYEIAKNACIDAFRRSKRAEEVSFDAEEGLAPADHGKLAAAGPTPDAAVAAKQQLDDLCGAFGGLSEAHHQILVMRELEGLSYREIGERLGMSRPSVESTLFRARRRLTEEYEELVTGERCLRIQGIIAAAAGPRALGIRDQRRVGTHVSYCRPCRKQAVLAGLDPGAMARRPVRAKIAASLPLPAFLRKRWLPGGGSDAATTQAMHHGSSMAQLSAAAAQYGEPTMAGWMKAAAVATAVVVAGVGSGAVDHRASRPATHHDAPVVQRAAASGGGGGAAGGAIRRQAASSTAGAITARSGTTTGRRSTRAPGPAAPAGGVPTSGAPTSGGGPAAAGGSSSGSSSSGGGSADPAGSSAATDPSAVGGALEPASSGPAGAVTQTVTDAAAGATGAAGAATGGGGSGDGGAKPLIQPDLTPLTQAPATTPPPSSAGAVVSGATGAVGQTVGGQVGSAVTDTGQALGDTVDQTAQGLGGAVGALVGGK